VDHHLTDRSRGVLDELQAGPAGLVLEGEAGIGKTTLWADVVARGRTSLRVLSARPAEAHLGFAALTDLMEPVLDEVGPVLPEPQRHALAVALLREQPGPGRLDQRAVSAATLSVLRTLAAAGPLLVARSTTSRPPTTPTTCSASTATSRPPHRSRPARAHSKVIGDAS
jgi:hypothetical protein